MRKNIISIAWSVGILGYAMCFVEVTSWEREPFMKLVINSNSMAEYLVQALCFELWLVGALCGVIIVLTVSSMLLVAIVSTIKMLLCKGGQNNEEETINK